MRIYVKLLLMSILIFTGCSKQEGCTDIIACNYNNDAEIDDGTCEYPEINYNCANECISDSDNDGLCDEDDNTSGCTDENACNYNSAFTLNEDLTSCIYPDGYCDECSGETDGTGVILDNDDDDDGLCNEDEYLIFSLCEGNFQADNSSLWYFDNNYNVLEPENNPIGDTGQSMLVDNNKLYVVMNGSGLIHVFNLNPNGIQLDRTINLDFSGPRYMEIYNGNAFITEWNTNQIRVFDLDNDQTISTIEVNGMPEQIFMHENYFYISINMNSDWTASERLLKLNPDTYEIEMEYTTAPNPSDLVVIENKLFVSSTYYDTNWNTYHAMTKIDLSNGETIIYNDESGINYSGDIFNIEGSLYRATNYGVINLDLNTLSAIPGTEIGNFDDVYSVEFMDSQFYFGRTDYAAPDYIDVLDTNGSLIKSMVVGAIPGSFAIWNKN